jgi:AraC family transcriptional regulator
MSLFVQKSAFDTTPMACVGASVKLSGKRVNLNVVPETTPTELVNFANMASHPRNIEITNRITSGAVTIGRYLLPPNPGVVLGAVQHAVMVHEGLPFELEWLLPGSDTEHKRMEHGDVDIHPCDTLSYRRWRTSSKMLFLAIDRSFVAKIVEKVFDRRAMELKPRIGLRDTVIQGMAEAWREELQVGGAGGRVHAEALGTALIVHLFRTYGEGGATLRTITGGMNGMRLRRVADYIEAHLSEDIDLCSLASLAGYSVHHFNDVFKLETGFSPYQYLIERRIHRAKEILLGTEVPIAQVALDVGFSGQSHFTEHFRKLTGTTPLRFRREAK